MYLLICPATETPSISITVPTIIAFLIDSSLSNISLLSPPLISICATAAANCVIVSGKVVFPDFKNPFPVVAPAIPVTSPTFDSAKAAAELQIEHNDDAIVLLNKALKYSKDSPNTYYLMALANNKLKKWDATIDAAQKGLLLAGADAYFGYPITPQSEVIEYLMVERPEDRTGMVVLLAESEIAAINMVYGAASAGKKVLTSSSSPGISLKLEGISYLAGAFVIGNTGSALYETGRWFKKRVDKRVEKQRLENKIE